jgi:hypothetical protein
MAVSKGKSWKMLGRLDRCLDTKKTKSRSGWRETIRASTDFKCYAAASTRQSARASGCCLRSMLVLSADSHVGLHVRGSCLTASDSVNKAAIRNGPSCCYPVHVDVFNKDQRKSPKCDGHWDPLRGLNFHMPQLTGRGSVACDSFPGLSERGDLPLEHLQLHATPQLGPAWPGTWMLNDEARHPSTRTGRVRNVHTFRSRPVLMKRAVHHSCHSSGQTSSKRTWCQVETSLVFVATIRARTTILPLALIDVFRAW